MFGEVDHVNVLLRLLQQFPQRLGNGLGRHLLGVDNAGGGLLVLVQASQEVLLRGLQTGHCKYVDQ